MCYEPIPSSSTFYHAQNSAEIDVHESSDGDLVLEVGGLGQTDVRLFLPRAKAREIADKLNAYIDRHLATSAPELAP